MGNFLHVKSFLFLSPKRRCSLNIKHPSYPSYYLSLSHWCFCSDTIFTVILLLSPTTLEFPIKYFDHPFLSLGNWVYHLTMPCRLEIIKSQNASAYELDSIHTSMVLFKARYKFYPASFNNSFFLLYLRLSNQHKPNIFQLCTLSTEHLSKLVAACSCPPFLLPSSMYLDSAGAVKAAHGTFCICRAAIRQSEQLCNILEPVFLAPPPPGSK